MPHVGWVRALGLIVLFMTALLFVVCVLRRIQTLTDEPVPDPLFLANVPFVGRTGDLLLFASRFLAPPAVRRFAHGSDYSHVGMLVLDDATGEPYVWESTPAVVPRAQTQHPNFETRLETANFDLLTGTWGKSGPQLVSLRQKLADYPGWCCLVPLPELRTPERADALAKRLPAVFARHSKRRFTRCPRVCGAALAALLDCRLPGGGSSVVCDDDGRSGMTCVELLQATWTELGILPTWIDLPKDIDHHCRQRGLPFYRVECPRSR